MRAICQVETLEGRLMMSVAAMPRVSSANTIDPKTTDSTITYKSFAQDPLFSSQGPSINDVNQGDLGDCYLMAALASVAKTDPKVIRKDIVSDGNGLYTVTVAKTKKITVNADLPVFSDGQLAYAQFGQQDSLWVAVWEKAYVLYASPKAHTYSSISGGWMTTGFAALGVPCTENDGSTSATNLLQMLQTDLKAGDAVTIATPSKLPAGSPLVNDHCYTVCSVTKGKGGIPVSVTLRNPWGDGAANDGYITISATRAFTEFDGVVIGNK